MKALRPARHDADGRDVTTDQVLPELGTLPIRTSSVDTVGMMTSSVDDLSLASEPAGQRMLLRRTAQATPRDEMVFDQRRPEAPVRPISSQRQGGSHENRNGISLRTQHAAFIRSDGAGSQAWTGTSCAG